jgi:hypothetical protein
LQPPEEAGEDEAMGHWIGFTNGSMWKMVACGKEGFPYRKIHLFLSILILLSIFLSHRYVSAMAWVSVYELAHRLLLTTQPSSK